MKMQSYKFFPIQKEFIQSTWLRLDVYYEEKLYFKKQIKSTHLFSKRRKTSVIFFVKFCSSIVLYEAHVCWPSKKRFFIKPWKYYQHHLISSFRRNEFLLFMQTYNNIRSTVHLQSMKSFASFFSLFINSWIHRIMEISWNFMVWWMWPYVRLTIC